MPRAGRSLHMPGLELEHEMLYEKYSISYDSDLFPEEDILLGDILRTEMVEYRRQTWSKTVMGRSSKQV